MQAHVKVPVELGAVPETLLWTLYHRALEARRPDSVIDDERAVDLVERIDYPFAERFGLSRSTAQWQALRACCFDLAVKRFLRVHPDGTVVALGEGLETQFWRIDNDTVRWLTVDLPEAIEVRRELLPHGPRQRTLACSVLERRWLDEVDSSRGVLVTAQGLLMYLEAKDVHEVISACAARFGGASLVFDAVPQWLAHRSRNRGLGTASGYQPPPWHWGLDADEERRLRGLPGVADLGTLRLPRGRGPVQAWLLPAVSRTPWLRRQLLSVHVASFA